MNLVAASPEKSLVTILSVDTVASTKHIVDLDPDDAQEFLDGVLTHLSEKIEKADGHLTSFHGDGGIAVFGWPNSLENHADRACEAAWAIQQGDSLQTGRTGETVEFRIGIHSGLVGFRQLRLEAGQQLDLVGGTVHLAAALEKNAPPQGILVSSNTVNLCRSRLRFTEHKTIAAFADSRSAVYQLRGLENRLQRSAGIPAYATQIVGRVTEQRILCQALSSRSHGSNAITILGEPGIGKSRLAAAVIEKTDGAERRLLVFRGDARKRTTPFALMRALVFNLAGLDELAMAEQVENSLRQAGLDEARIRGIRSVFFPQNARRDKQSVSTQTQVARAFNEAFLFLCRLSPTLVLVEDLHLVDPESCVCLRLLAARDDIDHVSLLITGRPEAEAIAQSITRSLVKLEPLPRDEMAELADKLLSDKRASHGLLDRALDRAEGIPFVLEQMILALDTEPGLDFDPLPQSVESLIHGRLNKLSNETKMVAQAISIFGEEVEIALVKSALDKKRRLLERSMSELERLGLVHPITGDYVRFRHTIIAEACATTVSTKSRRNLHKRALNTILALYSDPGPNYERLAIHAAGAGDDGAALEYLWQAGLRTRRSSATSSLKLIFERAMECVERIGPAADERFVDFVLMACTALLQLGDITEMKAHLPRAMELARARDQPEKVCGAMCHTIMICWFEGRYAEGLEYTDSTVELAESLKSYPLIFAAKLAQAYMFYGSGRIERAIGVKRELCDMLTGDLETVRLGGAAIPGSISRLNLGWFLLDVGGYEEALSRTKEALDIAVRAGDAYSEVLARTGIGRCLLVLGRSEEAEECLSQARQLVEESGYDAILPNTVGHLCTALARNGKGRTAVEMVESWFQRGLERRTGRFEMFFLYAGYAEALGRIGETDKSLAAIDHAIGLVRSMGHHCLTVQGLGLRARLYRELLPASPMAENDISEQRELCDKYGLAAWPQ